MKVEFFILYTSEKWKNYNIIINTTTSTTTNDSNYKKIILFIILIDQKFILNITLFWK